MAVTDVFNRRPLTVGKAFAADSAAFKFVTKVGTADPGDLGAGMLIHQMGFQYQQPVNRIYELQSQDTYYVAGRPQGNGNFGRVLGPGLPTLTFYQTFGDVCKSHLNTLRIDCAAHCGPPPGDKKVNGISYCLTGVTLNNVGMRVAAQDMLMNEDLGFMFVALEVCTGSLIVDAWPNSLSCEPLVGGCVVVT